MDYQYNPDLPIIKAGWPGNPVKDGVFQYLQDDFFPDWRVVLRMMTTPNPQRAEKLADKWRPAVVPHSDWLHDRERDFLVWLGHATFVIQLGGVRFITDPVLNSMPLVPRLVFPPFATEKITGIDYILLSHDHRDHCDEKTLRQLLKVNPGARILAPLGMEKTIGKWIGTTPLELAGWYQQYNLPATAPQVTYLPTRHWSRRGLFDFNEVLWGAFMFTHQNRHYYFGGDSALQWHYADTATLFTRIELAMLGIGAYAPDYMMQGAHTNPEEAVEAWHRLGARRMLPMHYGTFDLGNEPIGEPYRRVQAAAAARQRRQDLLLPAVNEVVELSFDSQPVNQVESKKNNF